MEVGRRGEESVLVIAGVLFVGLVWLVRWPLWALAVLALMIVMALLGLEKLVRLFQRSDGPAPVVNPTPPSNYMPPTPPPVQLKEERITDVRLPSRDIDYKFVFSAQAVWRPARPTMNDRSVNLGALAVDSVLQRARSITEQGEPGQVSLIRHELGRALAEMQGDTTGRVGVMANSVQLELMPEDQDRLDKLSKFRKDSALWEQERNYERSRREYLSSDALKDPGSAVIWWLARNDERIDKTVEDIGLLTRLTAAANNTGATVPTAEDSGLQSSPQQPTYFTGRIGEQYTPDKQLPLELFASFLSAVDLSDGDPERILFARRVASLMAKLNRADLAEEMIRRFATPNGVQHSHEYSGVDYPGGDTRSAENGGSPVGDKQAPAAPAAQSDGLGFPPQTGSDDERFRHDDDGY